MSLPNLSAHLGSQVPIFGGSTEDPPPIPLVDHQTARIIVGNALAGDTIAVCNILDPGDGTGIQAAVTAAAALGAPLTDVFVRSGTYTLTAANPLITVPANIALLGAGEFNTIIVGTSVSGVSQQMFSFGAGSSAEDMSFTSPATVAGVLAPTDNGVVKVAQNTKFKRTTLTMIGAPAITRSAYRGFVYNDVALTRGILFEDCTVKSQAITLSTAAVAGFAIRRASGSIADMDESLSFVRCRFETDGGETTTPIAFTVSYPFAVFDDCSAVGGSSGIANGYTLDGGVTCRGVRVSNFTHDARGRSVSARMDAVAMTIQGAGTTLDIDIDNVRMLGDANTDGNSQLCILTAFSASVITGVNITNVENGCSVAASGSVTLTGGTATISRVWMRGHLAPNGNTVVTGSAISNIDIEIPARVDATIQEITSGTSATINPWTKTVLVNTGAGAFSLTGAPVVPSRQTLIQKTSTDVNPITYIRNAAELINGVAANYVLPGSASATQPAWLVTDTSSTTPARWVN